MQTTSFQISIDESHTVSAEMYMPNEAKALFVFAHGAGAGMHHSFMKELSVVLAQHQIATLRYNFLYMELKKNRPDFPAVAHKAVAAAIQVAAQQNEIPIFAGGKSFGGRMTSQYLSIDMITQVRGIIFVGFPLHPQGKPATDRADHLHKIRIPMLFLQGTKDALAEWSLIEGVCAQLPAATLTKFEGADHAFKMPKQRAIPLLAGSIDTWIEERLRLRS